MIRVDDDQSEASAMIRVDEDQSEASAMVRVINDDDGESELSESVMQRVDDGNSSSTASINAFAVPAELRNLGR